MKWWQSRRESCAAQSGAARADAGFGLVEVLVAAVVLAFGILCVGSIGTATVRQMGTARGDLHLWVALQTIGDSLQQTG